MREKLEFLVLQHVPYEHMGIYAQVAEEQNVELNTLQLWKNPRPRLAKRYRDNLYDGLVIMGGPMSVYQPQDFPSKDFEMAVIKSALKAGVPILGICLGSQLIAEALGAKVYAGTKGIGFSNVTSTRREEGHYLFNNLPSPLEVLEWHGDEFDLPKGAVRLATSPNCENQAFSYGKGMTIAFGILFHLEATPFMINEWIKEGRQWIHEDFEIDENKLKEQALIKAVTMAQHGRQLFSNFIAIARGEHEPS
ncbi:gamma-glutamyl-gamma-aminobutyrate hydrolase family protein [Candidatus Daviesbacteria bacterium]|nr:gamma-glutamyl-gamma-aminobutyrate hydrolase family protein [Candidatus Daviesbacteria bacterium]MBI4035337.1 gamma-glutamyl-gamma-aminobutyrate hydrolase family protein [Candidatus Daviesbacteria bacterium]